MPMTQKAWDATKAVYASLDEPEWEVSDHLPRFFWDDHYNHKRYFKWLGRTLGFKAPFDWLPWMLDKIPDGFWSKPANVSQYLRWLGNRLGFNSVEQWQQLTAKQLRAKHGGGLIMKMNVPDIRAAGVKLSF